MYISSLYYMKEEWRKVAVCMYYHFIITRKNEEKLRFVYIISSLQHGRMRKSFAVCILSLFCSREGSGRDLVCIYQHFIITWKDEESCGMFILLLYCLWRYSAQNAKSRGGIVILRAYGKRGTYPWNIQSGYRKKSRFAWLAQKGAHRTVD